VRPHSDFSPAGGPAAPGAGRGRSRPAVDILQRQCLQAEVLAYEQSSVRLVPREVRPVFARLAHFVGQALGQVE
jgi:hypothetical protein